MKKEALFLATNLSLKFNIGEQLVTPVNNANIMIPEKEITIIYGASGSGKSSLLNVISGLQAPTEGTITFAGSNIYDKTSNELAFFRANQLGIVYQTNYWVKSLTVLENVAMPLYFCGLSRLEAHKRAKIALERVHMGSYADKHPALLSGGEQQRVAMARGIITDPPVMIADEPTGNLDSENGDKIIELLKELNKEGKTIILVTHNMEYLAIAQHLLEVKDGTVTEIRETEIPKTVKVMLGEAQKRIVDLMGQSS